MANEVQISNITNALATLESHYAMHKEKFEQWKRDNEKQRGSETYNKYVEQFKHWEAGVQDQRRQLLMERNNIYGGLVDIDQTLDVLLAGISFEDFMVAVATMTSKDQKFFPTLLSFYKKSAGEARTYPYQNFQTSVPFANNVMHPYSTQQQYAPPTAPQSAMPSYPSYSLTTRPELLVGNVLKRPFDRNMMVPPSADKWKLEEPPRKNFRAPSPVKDYRNPSTLPFRDFSQK